MALNKVYPSMEVPSKPLQHQLSRKSCKCLFWVNYARKTIGTPCVKKYSRMTVLSSAQTSSEHGSLAVFQRWCHGKLSLLCITVLKKTENWKKTHKKQQLIFIQLICAYLNVFFFNRPNKQCALKLYSVCMVARISMPSSNTISYSGVLNVLFVSPAI